MFMAALPLPLPHRCRTAAAMAVVARQRETF
jgi:hypothetical protein